MVLKHTFQWNTDNSRECIYRCGNLNTLTGVEIWRFFSTIWLVSNQNSTFSNQIDPLDWIINMIFVLQFLQYLILYGIIWIFSLFDCHDAQNCKSTYIYRCFFMSIEHIYGAILKKNTYSTVLHKILHTFL